MFLPWIWVMQFATDFFVGQAATFDLSHCLSEAVVIITVTLIVTKRLLVKIAEQMERLDADVGSMKGTLQEAPEILHRVRVDSTLDIGDRMVDDLVGVLSFQPLVGEQLVGVESRSCFDTFLDFILQGLFLPVFNYSSLDFTAPLYESDNGGFTLHAASGDAALPLCDVHVPRLAAA